VSDEITRKEKIEFLKHMFPNEKYSLDQIATWMGCERKSVYYWLEMYEVPTIKFNGSPFVMQWSFIAGLLRADKKNRKEDKLQGIEFVIADLKNFPK
jgi:hypothetical protein